MQVHSVMWWIAEGHRPTPAEAMARLAKLREHGAGPQAFTFKEFFAPPDPA